MKTFPIIALVDDDPDDLFFILEALQQSTKQFKIAPFQSGLDFLKDIVQSGLVPVLVVLDYNMPILNAEQLLLKMKEYERLVSVKVFIMSTGMNPKLEERLLALGAFYCVAKPTSITGYKELAINIIKLAMDLQILGEHRKL